MKSHFKKVDIEQNSPEWDTWRASKIGASEIPVIMKESSLKKRNDLLEEKKTGIKEEISDFVQNQIFNPGHVFEEMMRPLISQRFGFDFEKACYERTDVDFLSASYDGLDIEMLAGWECKRSEKEMKYIIEHEKPSSNYYGQVQAQIYMCNLKSVLFTAGIDAETTHTIKVFPDADYISSFIKESKKFKKQWDSKEVAPPQLGPLIVRAMRIKRLISKLKKQEVATMKSIKELKWSENFKFENASFSISSRKTTSLDIEKLQKDFKFELKKYQSIKKSSTFLIKEVKK